MHCQLLRKHSSFPVTYILVDKNAVKLEDCRVLTFYSSNSSHFSTWLKKETTSYISKQLRSVSRAAVYFSCILQHDILYVYLPCSFHTNKLVVIITQILCRFTLGLPK